MSPAKKTQKTAGKSTGLTAEEKMAMREIIKERKMAANKEAMEKALHEKIAEMEEPDRSLAKRIHTIVTSAAPDLRQKPGMECPPMPTRTARLFASSRLGVSLVRDMQPSVFSQTQNLIKVTCGKPPSR